MSLLQPILEQLNRERGSAETTATPGGGDNEDFPQGLRTSSLGCHASWYRENLSQCSEAMLQYEWTWMNGHIDALERYLCDAEGREAEPDFRQAFEPNQARLEALLSESQLFLTLLLREFASRGLRPAPPKAPVIPSEEAWEITSARVRQDWGIV
jgi:hypothetical protein